jgi:N-acetylmuramoyl-L-alanine amidase
MAMDPILPGTARFQSSPNRGSKFGAPLPDTLVIHYTAGLTLDSAVRTLCDPAAKASAHFVVDRDGKVVQLVEIDTVAWHAGVSRHLSRSGLNKYSLGIEIVNAGRLNRTAAGEFVTWFGSRVEAKDALQLLHRNESALAWWHAYTEQQVESVFELSRQLVAGLPIKNILGHEEIAPGRKSDPGPAFPLDQMRARLLGTHRDADEESDELTQVATGVISASLLNTRTGPSVLSPVASVPLRRGTAVTIVGSQPGWLKISSPLSAWVKREHVDISFGRSAGQSRDPSAMLLAVEGDSIMRDTP